MSDSLRTYHAVKERVCQTLPAEDAHLVSNVSLMVTGLVRSRSVWSIGTPVAPSEGTGLVSMGGA